MHKQILFNFMIIVMLLTSFQLAARKPNPVSYGLKVSPSIAWISATHNDVQSDGATVKFGAGIVSNYRLTSLFSIVSGLNYNAFGGYVMDNASLGSTTIRNNFLINYKQLEVPIALRIRTDTIKKTSFYLQGGISLGLILSAKEKRIPLAKNSVPIYTNVLPYTNPLRLGFQVGAGLEHRIYRWLSVFGQITYNNSISNTANGDKYIANDRYTQRLLLFPGSMEFSVGVMF